MAGAAPEQFDLTARRFHQWGVILLTAIAFVLDGTAGGALMVAIGLVMVVGRFRDEADLIRGFYQSFLRPRGILREDWAVEDRATRRVARVLGGTAQIVGGALLLAGGYGAIAWGLIGLITAMIALDALFSFCALCFVVHQFQRQAASA